MIGRFRVPRCRRRICPQQRERLPVIVPAAVAAATKRIAENDYEVPPGGGVPGPPPTPYTTGLYQVSSPGIRDVASGPQEPRA